MINRNRASLVQFIIHRVGNKFNSTKNTYSKQCVHFDEDSYDLMLPFLLKSFTTTSESFRFAHHADVNLNEINVYCHEIFNDISKFQEYSENIVKHLYEQSNSANIKTGEVLIAYFEELLYEDRPVSGIGIFKIESKLPYFQIFNNDANDLDVLVQKGISTKKIDKGCLILNTKDEEGSIVFSIDNNNYDAQYWFKHFLNIRYAEDKNRHTQMYIDLCKEFSEEIILEESGKKEQAEFLAQTVSYLTDNEDFNFNDFVQEIIIDEEVQEKFKQYKTTFEQEREILVRNTFEVSTLVLNKERKKIKSEIKLDTNISIKIDINDPETASDNIELGYDEEKKMKFYKIYFNEEK